MTHISHTELNKRTAEAIELVELGAIYKHYKYPEHGYKSRYPLQERRGG